MSSCVSRGVWRNASTAQFKFGWLVPPLIDAIAASAISTPASAAFNRGGGVDAAGVMRMEVNGNFDFFAQGLDQRERGVRLAQTRHILDGQKMCAQLLQLPGHLDVVFQGIFWATLVEYVAGIANRGFADCACLQDCVDGDAHIFNGVQRIEDAENIDALLCGFADKINNHIVGIRGVADRICSAQQHLETNVGDTLAQFAQALPRIFVQESAARCRMWRHPTFPG